MQENLDDQIIQLKKICGFDVVKERSMNELSIYDYMYHLAAWSEEGIKGEQHQ